MSLENKIESVSNRAHESWTGWMKYLFQKGTMNEDGSFTIDPEMVKRWTRQMNSKYEELSEKEKESDRIEAIHYLSIFYKD